MAKAQSLFESIALPIARQIRPMIHIGADEKLAQWVALHGWDGSADRQIIAHQAALNLVLRALVWHCLDADSFPPTAPADYVLQHSNHLLQRWGIVQPTFYLDELAVRARTTVQEGVIDKLASALRNDPSDVLGDIYSTWIPQEARRPLGQFWTPVSIARLMAQWAIRSPDDLVLDPAVGSGVLLEAATQRLFQLGASSDHVSRQVSGIELSPLAFLLGVINLLLHHPDVHARLQCGDFLLSKQVTPRASQEPAASYTIGNRQLILPGLETEAPTTFPERFDAIVCNPPYTRHHHLPETYKSFWADAMQREYGLRLSRFSSLFAYFFVQATRMLSPTGRMAFITPATVFEATYSRQVKEFMHRQLHLRAIVTFDETMSVFEGVDTAACITLVEGPQAPKSDSIIHLQIREWPGTRSVLAALEQQDPMAPSWGNIQRIDRSALDARRKWTVIGRNIGMERLDADWLVPLSDIAHIVRGIATGANDFFVLSDGEVAAWGLESAPLRPVLTKTREAPGYAFRRSDFERLGHENKKRWLLYLTGPVAPESPVARYVQYGERQKLHQRSLVKTRSPWYTMEQRDPAPIYFTYLSRRRSRFIHNQADVLALNVFLCIYPIPAISQDDTALKALLAVLNSTLSKDSLRAVGRSYGSDTVKIEPREMDRLPVVNPLRLPEETRQRLAALFDRLCDTQTEEAERSIRRAISKTITSL